MAETLAHPVVDDALLAEVVHRFLAVGFPKKIVLFGSRARGDANEDSDYDLLVIEDSDKPRWKRSPVYYLALSGLDPEIDVVVWTPDEIEEWAEVSNFFITTVLREGRTLYDAG